MPRFVLKNARFLGRQRIPLPCPRRDARKRVNWRGLGPIAKSANPFASSSPVIDAKVDGLVHNVRHLLHRLNAQFLKVALHNLRGI